MDVVVFLSGSTASECTRDGVAFVLWRQVKFEWFSAAPGITNGEVQSEQREARERRRIFCRRDR